MELAFSIHIRPMKCAWNAMCVNEVRKNNGIINYENAVEYQKE